MQLCHNRKFVPVNIQRYCLDLTFNLSLRVKESTGWQQVFTSPRLDWVIDRVALNAKVMAGSLGDNDKMVAVASATEIILWAICPDGNGNEIGESRLTGGRFEG